jgi:tagatose 1,6-diphosphate aldolase
LKQIVPGEPARGFAPFYHFAICVESAEVGHINFRVGDSEHVLFVAGHIGYQVLEAFRGHRYAYSACRALAPLVRSVYPAVIITSDPDNFPSLRTIERLGAVFLDEVPVPPSDPNYQRGSRAKRRYQWTP